MAEYIEYRDVMDRLRQGGLINGPEPSFLEYYDFKARNFAWKNPGPGNQAGQALGVWGYVFVLLGAVGFCLCGLIAPALLYAVPYCTTCQRYMKTKLLGVLPASVPVKKIAKNNQEAQGARQGTGAGCREADEALVRLQAALAEGRTDRFKEELLAAGAIKANEKLPKRARVSLNWCNVGQEGEITMTLVSRNGDAIHEAKLAVHLMPATFVSEILANPAEPNNATE